MIKILIALMFYGLFFSNVYAFDPIAASKGWREIKGNHFTVLFPPSESDGVPQAILQKSEEYYNAIADNIGYSRYGNIWTWDARVQIFYFSDQASYSAATGQPSWSKGFSGSHMASVNMRMIVSFRGQENFLTTVLPHEIGHLIMHDFMGAERKLPVWFDEGVAQLEEDNHDDEEHKRILARLMVDQKTIPLSLLEEYGLSPHNDATEAGIFYAESLYIVDFLIKTYGKDAFRQMCRHLRDGGSFNEALRSAYYPGIDSMVALQDKWVKYMVRFIH